MTQENFKTFRDIIKLIETHEHTKDESDLHYDYKNLECPVTCDDDEINDAIEEGYISNSKEEYEEIKTLCDNHADLELIDSKILEEGKYWIKEMMNYMNYLYPNDDDNDE